jgi:hypothetical protein
MKYNTHIRGVPARVALDKLADSRRVEKPQDIKGMARDFSVDDGELVHGDQHYALTPELLSDLCDIADVPTALVSKLTSITAGVVLTEMLEASKSKAFVRTVEINGVREVRMILRSKYNVMDDRPFFRKVAEVCRLSGWLQNDADYWVSDTCAAVRIYLSELPEASKMFGVPCGYAIDFANSEVKPGASWVKGVLVVDGNGLIVPNILGAKASSDLLELVMWAANFANVSAEAQDALVCNGFRGAYETVFGSPREADSLVRRKFITRDVAEDLANTLGFVAFMRRLAAKAAELDCYQRRSAMEYIANLWAEDVRVK